MDSAMKWVMEFLRNPPSPSTMFNAYASLSGSIMILQSTPNPIPPPIGNFLWFKIQQYFLGYRRRSIAVITVEESWGAERNLFYSAAKVYIPTKISPASLTRVKMGKIRSQKNISVALPEKEEIVDTFNNVKVTWRYVCTQQTEQTRTYNGGNGLFSYSSEKRYFELSFDPEHREEIVSAYLQHVMNTAALLEQGDKELMISSCNDYNLSCGLSKSNSTYLQHPASFDTIALDPDLKQSIIDDLDRFLAGRDYYKRIGKTWKRGYLLYGPPGTGKSSLIVAMAKYLKYDVYDLELSSIHYNSQLRSVFLNISSKSIIVIEDVDCYEEVQARSNTVDDDLPQLGFQENKRDACALSGLLNAIDGLWSGCGEERIIIFTTNHKDKIDPALLRPGRMDMHIELSYLRPLAFSVLAYNYLGLRDGDHPLLEEIQTLLEYTEVTPASVAEELLRSDDVNVALGGVVELLKRKRMAEVNDSEDEGAAKRRKLSEMLKCFPGYF